MSISHPSIARLAALLCSLGALACAAFITVRVTQAQVLEVDGCSAQMYLDRSAPGADRSFDWNYAFANDPERCIIVRVGQTVSWQGNFGDHPLDADEGDRPSPIDAHIAGVVRFDQPGIYGYRCKYHLEMRGAVRVLPAIPAVPWAGPTGLAGLGALLLGIALFVAQRASPRSTSAADARRSVQRRNMFVPNSDQPLTALENLG